MIELLKKKALLFDGAMGTMLQSRGLPVGELPELYNLTQPGIIAEIHKEYAESGANIITSNTFQCSRYKLPKEVDVAAVITAGVGLAKASGGDYTALDVGPLGQLLKPLGTLSFQEAYDAFKEQVVAGEKAGADLVLFETFGDQRELKAAILAAKENTNLPIFATLTFQEDGRTFVGVDPVTAVLSLQDLGLSAIGINCSLGPKEIIPFVKQMLLYARIPIIVQANAGLPILVEGETVYKITPEEFSLQVAEMLQLGVGVVGGCCGTTPEFIAALRPLVDAAPKPKAVAAPVCACTSGSTTVFIEPVTVIGERINPTGKPLLQQAIVNQKWDYLLRQGIEQVEAGASILDVNVGLPDINEALVLSTVIEELQGVVTSPLQIDSASPKAIEAGLRAYNGKGIINSLNGKQASMDAIFPIAKKYGALVVCLTLDESGIPATAAGRFAIAERIVREGEKYGIPKEYLLFDCLTLTASAQQDQVLVPLETIKRIKRELGCKTVLGVSNVSFGLPNRPTLNATFLASALGAGLDAPILDPLSVQYMEVVDSYGVFSGQDKGGEYFISQYSQEKPKAAPTSHDSLQTLILQGRKGESGAKVKELITAGTTPLNIVNQHFIPALDIVGEGFGKGRIFLPQLIQSAETVKNGFEMLKSLQPEGTETKGKKIILATVEGDIHDIGKNIVKMVLENYGYNVIDLGKDVPIKQVLKAAQEQDVHLIGLSALMTTTVKSMKKTISLVRESGHRATFMVGGAVLSQEYTQYVGGDFYAKTAMDSVAIAQKFFEKG